MSRVCVGVILSLLLFAGVLPADESRFRIVTSQGVVLDGAGQPGAPARSPSPNDELIALLKKAIQILEAQSGKQPPQPVLMRRAVVTDQSPEVRKARYELTKRLQELQFQVGKQESKPMIRVETIQRKPATPELDKARAEVKAAEQRLQEAKARLAKLEAQPAIGSAPSYWMTTPRREPAAAPKSPDLEKRLDRLEQALEEIRRELKKGRN